MKFKRFILVILIGIFCLVLLATNYVFFSAYIDAYMVSRYGERTDAKIMKQVHKPGSGYRGYTYMVKLDGEIRKMFIKSKLEVNEIVSVIISPTDQGRMFLLKEEGNVVSIFNGITGGWFMSILFLFMHIFILKISWLTFIKIPFEWFQKKLKVS